MYVQVSSWAMVPRSHQDYTAASQSEAVWLYQLTDDFLKWNSHICRRIPNEIDMDHNKAEWKWNWTEMNRIDSDWRGRTRFRAIAQIRHKITRWRTHLVTVVYPLSSYSRSRWGWKHIQALRWATSCETSRMWLTDRCDHNNIFMFEAGFQCEDFVIKGRRRHCDDPV